MKHGDNVQMGIGFIINRNSRKLIAFKAQKQYPLVLLVKKYYKQGEAMGSKEVRVMETGLINNF